MALFGFNKQKVLASAEKYVQQGKLQNAISEYEKILKNDAKDLTVTNTVGDLYSRLGETEKATTCFKTVGDAYASQGFTVKAIAMYKKICKLAPSLESLLKLAELYTQQGLFNDARAQYLQVAEEFLKAGELENAIRIFQKILEMDPENSPMRVRLAEVYVRLGKKNEAWQIFSAAAESLRAKGSLGAAEEVLQRMLTLDPGNAYALLMQGKNMVESGDAAGAVTILQKVADLDSNPDGLRDLLKAYLLTGQLSEAGTIASKLLTVHNDLTAIASFSDALMQAGQYENALQVFDQHAERVLAENSSKVLDSLHTIIGHVRDNPDSLQKLLDLFHKAGESTHVSEVMELLAHASVQSGDLARSRDLYQKLAQIEPQNTLHMQNYQQVVSQLGGTSGSKLITPEEAVVLLDDLEASAPSVHQHYSDEVALSIRSALTDAELFISYNMPAKALGPLTGALPLAPNDLRINQRLAALHTRAGRFAEAALCCRTLQRIYSEAEYPEEATRYGELAERYEERSAPPVVAPADDAPVVIEASEPEVAEIEISEPEASIPEFSIDASPEEVSAVETETQPEAAAQSWPASRQPAAEPEFAVVDDSSVTIEPVSVEAEAGAEEIDLSSEWDGDVTVEAEAPPEEAPEAAQVEVPAPEPVELSKTDETIEEIRFYLDHGMAAQAMAALAKLQAQAPDHTKLEELRTEVEAAARALAEEEAARVAPVVEELSAVDIPSVEVEEVPAAAELAVEPEAAAAQEFAVAEVSVEPEPASTIPEPAAQVEPVKAEPVQVAAPAPVPVAATEPKPDAGPLKDFVTDLESSLGDSFLPGAVAHPAQPEPTPIASQHEPAVAEAKSAAVLGEFVADIEASLGEDFLKAAPVPEPERPAPAANVAPPPPAPVTVPKVAPPLAASAAASASVTHHVTPPAPQMTPAPLAATVAPPVPSASVAWTAPVVNVPQAPPIAPVPAQPATQAKSSPFGEDTGVDLAEMFGELKQDLEADVASADEDPETHYNLGIAFREMGLLDEAIGELQKACQAFDRGHAFPQIMQTYTWLAQCFLEKGVPEAAVRWYERALGVNGIDGETRVALNYELASAYETSGDRRLALKHFMDVYGSNIDYRDVAERIKALKS